MPTPAPAAPSEPLLKGRCALVTGASGGIGLAIAQRLAREGCHVVLHGLEEPAGMRAALDSVAAQGGAEPAYLRADLSDAAAVESLVAQARALHGGIDVLVNNAVTRHFAPMEDFTAAQWDRSLAVHVSAAFHAIRLCLPGMRARGYGRIFNMTSVYGERAVAGRVDYITSKAALAGLTRAVAMETLNHGITCNALCPGSVLTPNIDSRVQALMASEGLGREEAERRFLAGKQPTGRFVEAAHVAEMLIFLCGPAGRDITGATLPLEGGWLAQ